MSRSTCTTWTGLSPRVRGSPNRRSPGVVDGGSIPACAGEPLAGLVASPRNEVYPRVCGGADLTVADTIVAQGLSPRVRGSRAEVRDGRSPRGSIPACAGEPRSRRGSPASGRVYPRVCGEPWPCSRRPRWSRVYPRVCGGAGRVKVLGPLPAGLSPRVRGSPKETRKEDGVIRSIPACAGEPHPVSGHRYRGSVYPRVCGGAADRMSAGFILRGLSPRVRGSRVRRAVALV